MCHQSCTVLWQKSSYEDTGTLEVKTLTQQEKEENFPTYSNYSTQVSVKNMPIKSQSKITKLAGYDDDNTVTEY